MSEKLELTTDGVVDKMTPLYNNLNKKINARDKTAIAKKEDVTHMFEFK